MAQLIGELREATAIIRFPEMQHQPGTIGYVEKMLIGELLMMTQPRLVIETGTWLGETTRFVNEFLALNQLPQCRIVTFDLPDVLENLRRSDPYFGQSQQIELAAGMLPESLRRFLDSNSQEIDFAIVDANHVFESVTKELELIHTRLRPGGYVFCHDYREFDRQYEGVVVAVDRFVSAHKYDVLPLNASQWRGHEISWGAAILRKPPLRRSKLVWYSYQVRSTVRPVARRLRMWLSR